MKKLVTVIALGLIGAGSAYAQGTIVFANSTAYPLRIVSGNTTSVVGTASAAMGAGPASVRVQLWVGTAPGSLVLVGTATNSASTLSFAQGTFSGGNPFTLPAPFDGSAAVAYQYKAWSDLGSARMEDATKGFAGSTAVATGYTPATGINTPSPTFGGAGQPTGILLLPVSAIPEPSTFALAGLGLAGLMIFRRRK